jgi:hypothetical protein
MLRSDSASSSMFRSGPMNVYPVWLAVSSIQVFLPLTDLQILFLGRIILPLGLGALAVIPLALFLKYLTGLRFIGLVAAGLYVLSPFLSAVSRYWYPDHYLFFFAALVSMLSAKLVVTESQKVTGLLLGISFSMMISVKYHSAVLLLMVIMALWQRYRSRFQSGEKIRETIQVFCVFAASSILFTTILHLNTLLNFESFLEQQKFNLENYGRFESNPVEGFTAYLFVALVLMIGPLGLIAVSIAIRDLVKRRKFSTLGLLTAAPLILLIVLGFQGLFITRNVIPAGPALLALAAIGISRMVRLTPNADTLVKYLARVAVLSFFTIGQVGLATYSFANDLKPDSRIQAESWISNNIPADAIVGTNRFCFGTSAAEIAGRKTQDDPGMEQELDFYVFDSYSGSRIVSNFRGEQASIAFLEPKYFHFYYIRDRQLHKGLLGFFHEVPKVIPESYELLEMFEENGPAIWVLKKVN